MNPDFDLIDDDVLASGEHPRVPMFGRPCPACGIDAVGPDNVCAYCPSHEADKASEPVAAVTPATGAEPEAWSDPILEELLRAKGPEGIQAHALRRWQAHVREVLYPLLRGQVTRPEPTPLVKPLSKKQREAMAV